MCLSSDLSHFNHSSFDVGKSYNFRVLNDLETGVKTWETLNRSIDPTCWIFAQQAAASHDKKFASENLNEKVVNKKCTSWNTFFKDGCQFEFLNPGKNCRYIHSCSICDEHGLENMPHKAWECDNEFNDHQFNPHCTEED